MREVAEAAGYHDEAGNVNRCHVMRARRQLRRLEEKTGLKLLWGKPGGHLWTTLEALRQADPTMVEGDRADAEALDRLSETVDRQAQELRRHRAMFRDVCERLDSLESFAMSVSENVHTANVAASR